MLTIKPISIAKANAFVEQNHRHHGAKTGCRFALSVWSENELHGVAICSNPVARNADDGLTLEVARLCTDGTRNACSILYGACARVAKEMGFRKIQTYILESECGASLKASGWECEGEAGRTSWNDKWASERQKKRMEFQQMELIEKKKPPEEMKVRWARYFAERREEWAKN